MSAFQAAVREADPAPVERDEAAVAHAILTLRLIDSLDWTEMFEQLSLVDQALCRDPSGAYAYLDL